MGATPYCRVLKRPLLKGTLVGYMPVLTAYGKVVLPVWILRRQLRI